MNTHQRGRGNFEERLLDELRNLVVARPFSGPAGAPATSRSRRPLVLAGSMATLLAAGAAAGVPFLLGGAAPAYAVSTNDDGTVSVEITSLSDAAGLESKLREAGIPAVVQYLEPGKACKQPWFTPAPRPHDPSSPGHEPAIKGGVEHTGDGHTRFTISKHHPVDETLVIMTQVAADASVPPGAGSPESIGVAFAKGEVKPCEVVDAPAGSQPFGPPPPGAGELRTDGGTPGPGTTTAEPGH